MPAPRVVVWQLAQMESVPWTDLWHVAGAMKWIRPVAKKCITKNLIVLPGPNWQTAVNTLFGLAGKPAAPYEIFAGSLPSLPAGKNEEEQERQVRSGPRPRLMGVPVPRAEALGAAAPRAPRT